jgi:hypothetical protein
MIASLASRRPYATLDRRDSASRTLVSPVMLVAIAVLVVNDHVLKQAYPGVLTGKLSDVAGLVFFPVLLAAIAEQFGARGLRVLVVTTLATGIVFAAVKTIPLAADAYRVGLGALQWIPRALVAVVSGDAVPAAGRVALAMDPTDLVALPAVAVGVAKNVAVPRVDPACERFSP